MTGADGRTFLITGANTGIGLATASELASRGGRVYLACRSRAKARAAADSVAGAMPGGSVDVLELDLANLASVRACARDFLARGEPLHVLINNAGLAGRHGRTADGFELAFGVNHLGHFALTRQLLGCLRASAPSRVVTVASDAHYQATSIDFGALRRPARSLTGLPEYAVSKLCNVLFSQELARRAGDTGVTSYAVHPGVVASDIWRRVPWPVRPILQARMLSTEQGASTSVYCATAAELSQSTGRYYERCAERQASAVATAELASELWERSQEWTGC